MSEEQPGVVLLRQNPWGLTQRQGEALSAQAEHGCSKLAARALGIDHKTVDTHVQAAVERMGCRNRLQAVVKWDRWLNAWLPELPYEKREQINARLAARLFAACLKAAA